MAPHIKTPDQAWLRRHLAKNYSHAEMAELWEKETGIKVSRSAIAMAVVRGGLTTREWVRYERTVPWDVMAEHSRTQVIKNLRYLGRRLTKHGDLSDKEAYELDGWLKKLQEHKLIVAYDSTDPAGFFYIRDQWKDHDDKKVPIRRREIRVARDPNARFIELSQRSKRKPA